MILNVIIVIKYSLNRYFYLSKKYELQSFLVFDFHPLGLFIEKEWSTPFKKGYTIAITFEMSVSRLYTLFQLKIPKSKKYTIKAKY